MTLCWRLLEMSTDRTTPQRRGTRAFDTAAVEFGWERSLFDACLYFLRDTSGKLCGAMGVHVDDTALGGHGPYFDETVKRLKERFPYRKWRIQSGEFCGAFYTQDPQSKSISMSQQTFAENIRPAHIAKGADNEQYLQDSQIRVLRAINGSLNWIASQSRPDLAVQNKLESTSFSTSPDSPSSRCEQRST